MTQTKQFLINIISQFGASIISSIFSFAFMFLAARRLGAEVFGQFSTVQIYVNAFMALTDLGISNVIVRAVAQKKDDIRKLTSNLILLKLVLGAVVFAVIQTGALFLKYDIETQKLIFIYALSILPISIAYGCNAIFTGHEKLIYATITIFGNAIGIAISIILLLMHVGILGVFITLTTTSLIAAITSIIFLRLKFVKFSLNFDWQVWKPLILKSIPFGSIFLLSTFGLSFGPILLSKMYGNVPVGYFNLSNKLINPIMLFIGAYNAAIFPLFSRLRVAASDSLGRIFQLSLKVMAVVGILCAALITTVASKILALFFPGYENATGILILMSWTVLFSLLNTVTFNLLYSEHLEKTVTKIYVVSSVVSLILSPILISLYGVMGLGVCLILLGLVQFILSLSSISKIYPVNFYKIGAWSVVGSVPIIIIGFLLANAQVYILFIGMTGAFILSVLLSPVFNKEDRYLLFEMPTRNLLRRLRLSRA